MKNTQNTVECQQDETHTSYDYDTYVSISIRRLLGVSNGWHTNELLRSPQTNFLIARLFRMFFQAKFDAHTQRIKSRKFLV